MRYITSITSLLFAGIATALQLYGQAPGSKPATDVLIFTDGEKLIGQFESATGSSVKFKSNMTGEVTVDWNKIQELHTSEKFAAIPKDTKLTKSSDTSKVPQGTVTMTDQKLALTGGPGQSQTIPVGNVGNVVSEASFQKAFERTSLLQGWTGGATAGISLTEATQKNETYTAALNLVRSVPTEDWIDVRSRTIFTFNEADGTISQPATRPSKLRCSISGSSRIGMFPQECFCSGRHCSTIATRRVWTYSRLMAAAWDWLF